MVSLTLLFALTFLSLFNLVAVKSHFWVLIFIKSKLTHKLFDAVSMPSMSTLSHLHSQSNQAFLWLQFSFSLQFQTGQQQSNQQFYFAKAQVCLLHFSHQCFILNLHKWTVSTQLNWYKWWLIIFADCDISQVIAYVVSI